MVKKFFLFSLSDKREKITDKLFVISYWMHNYCAIKVKWVLVLVYSETKQSHGDPHIIWRIILWIVCVFWVRLWSTSVSEAINKLLLALHLTYLVTIPKFVDILNCVNIRQIWIYLSAPTYKLYNSHSNYNFTIDKVKHFVIESLPTNVLSSEIFLERSNIFLL